MSECLCVNVYVCVHDSLLDYELGLCVSLWGIVSMMVAPRCQLPACCVCKGRKPPLFLGAAEVGPGSGHLGPWQGSSVGTQSPSLLLLLPTSPASWRGAGNGGSVHARPGVRSPRRSRPAGPGELRQPPPPPPPLCVPPSLPSAIAGGVGGDFAGVSISYLAAKLSFCVSPSCSLQLLLSSEMPGQGKGPRASWPLGGEALGTRRAWGPGTGVCVGARRRGGGSARVVPSSSLCLCKASAVDRPQVKVKARAGGQGEGATGDGLGSTAQSLDVFWRWLAGSISERGAFEGISPSFQGGGGKEGEGDAVQLSCGPHRALVGPICAV